MFVKSVLWYSTKILIMGLLISNNRIILHYDNGNILLTELFLKINYGTISDLHYDSTESLLMELRYATEFSCDNWIILGYVNEIT